MTAHRRERVARELHRAIAEILHVEVGDPRLAGVTVTRVKVSKDLQNVRCYISSITEPPEGRSGILHALRQGRNFLRTALAPRIGLRHIPELAFSWDESIERSVHVSDILRQVSEELREADERAGLQPGPPNTEEDQDP